MGLLLRFPSRLCTGCSFVEDERGDVERAGTPAWVRDGERELSDEHVQSGVAWLLNDGLLDQYVLCASLAPQQRLMHELIAQNGQEFDVQQLMASKAGQPKSYRILSLACGSEDGGLFSRYKATIAERLGNCLLWEHCDRHERIATNILRFGLRGVATSHELLVLKAASFPTRLFKLLIDQREADEILRIRTTSACLLDSFSAKHLETFPTRDALTGAESLMILRNVADLFVGNIFSTESLHSKTTRRSKHRPTHSIALHDLALWLQGGGDHPLIQACIRVCRQTHR